MTINPNYIPLNTNEIIEVLRTKDLSVLGTLGINRVNLVPMWFAFDYTKGCFTMYFVSTYNGQKMTDIKDNGVVGIEVNQECRDALKTIVMNGTARIVKNRKEQEYIVEKFVKKFYNRPCILDEFKACRLEFIRVDVTEITGRKYRLC